MVWQSACALILMVGGQSLLGNVVMARGSRLRPEGRIEGCHGTRWYPARGESLGVAMVVHGLNTAPARMESMCRALTQIGVTALRVSLRGHVSTEEGASAPPEIALKTVEASHWRDDIVCAWKLAHAHAASTSEKVFFVGHSTGALAGLVALSEKKIAVDRMVLLAPALTTRWYVKLVRALSPWEQLTLPSAAEPLYRASQSGTPMKAYNALFALRSELEPVRRARLNVPSLVIIDEADELVDPDALRRFIRENGLDRWQGVSLTKSGARAARHHHHLIIDRRSVGQSAWQAMIGRIADHLLGH